MYKKTISLLLLLFLLSGSGCKLIYPNRVPVVKPRKHYGWYKPAYKHRKRTKIVWMKVHKGKFKDERPVPSPPTEGPLSEN
jgi:hypothetical protein